MYIGGGYVVDPTNLLDKRAVYGNKMFNHYNCFFLKQPLLFYSLQNTQEKFSFFFFFQRKTWSYRQVRQTAQGHAMSHSRS